METNSFMGEQNIYILVQTIIEKTYYLNDLTNKKKPEYYDAYIERGHAYTVLNQLAKAEIDFDLAILLNPNRSEAYFQKAIARYFYYGKYKGEDYDKNEDKNIIDSIVSNINRAIKIDRTNYKFYAFRGIFYLALNKFDLAKIDLEKAIELNPKDYYSCYHLGFALMKKDLDRAIIYFTKAISSEYQECIAASYHNLGVIYLEIEQFEPAIANFELALKQDPMDDKGYFLLAVIFYIQEKYIEALANIDAAMAINCEELDYFIFKTNILYKLGNDQDANQLKEIVLKKRMDNIMQNVITNMAGRMKGDVNIDNESWQVNLPEQIKDALDLNFN